MSLYSRTLSNKSFWIEPQKTSPNHLFLTTFATNCHPENTDGCWRPSSPVSWSHAAQTLELPGSPQDTATLLPESTPSPQPPQPCSDLSPLCLSLVLPELRCCPGCLSPELGLLAAPAPRREALPDLIPDLAPDPPPPGPSLQPHPHHSMRGLSLLAASVRRVQASGGRALPVLRPRRAVPDQHLAHDRPAQSTLPSRNPDYLVFSQLELFHNIKGSKNRK